MSSIRGSSGLCLVIILHVLTCHAIPDCISHTNYYPCSINEVRAITCNNPSSNDLLAAFQCNAPNQNIRSLKITGSESMSLITTSDLKQVLQLVGQGSGYTLQEIYISHIFMNRLPEGFIDTRIFPQLITLHLRNNHIYDFNPNAFQGDFSQVEIDLGFNPFFRLDKEVFLPLLESMNGNPGEISIFPSNIQCDCELTWLVRDRPDLVPDLLKTQCVYQSLSIPIEKWNWRDSNCPNKSNALKAISYTATVTLLLFSMLITKLLCW